MTPDHARRVLPIYRRNLEKYEADGDDEKADIQRRLIARLEKRAAEQPKKRGGKSRT